MTPDQAKRLMAAMDQLEIECGEAWANHVNDDLDVTQSSAFDWGWLVDQSYKRAKATASPEKADWIDTVMIVEMHVGRRVLAALERAIFTQRDNVCGEPDDIVLERREDIRPAPRLDWKGEAA